MSKLLAKLQKNTTIAHTSVLTDSVLFAEKDQIPTNIPALNIALSGSPLGGFVPGFTMWAGPSKHFKTLFSLVMVKAYLTKYPDAVALFYDSEFGTPVSYFESLNIDMDRVIHTPVTDVEQLKFDIMNQFASIDRGDKIITMIDSIGNLASKKEVEDAIDQKSVADMSRAKQLKSLFRMITPHLNLKDIPLIAVNHTYKEIGLFPKDIVGGGTGSYYSADNIYIVGRRQEKEGTELAGYNFIINVEKSRYVREKSQVPITVTFDSGLSRWTGMLDIAIDVGAVVKPSKGWYSKVDLASGEVEDKKYRKADTDSADFWRSLLEDREFEEVVRRKYAISANGLMGEEFDVSNQ